MSDCVCGHSLRLHFSGGCYATLDKTRLPTIDNLCPCKLSREDAEAIVSMKDSMNKLKTIIEQKETNESKMHS